MRSVPTRVLMAVGLIVVVALVGVLSVYASGRPDGLQRVADDHGLADRAREHATADGPLAGYRMGDGDDPRVPGLIGAGVVLVLASGTTYALRRHSRRDQG